MTSGVDPDERQWAAELLGVEPTATPTAARRAYFRKVRENEFVPPRSLDRALHIFDPRHGQAASDEEGSLEQERRLRADVEAFATDFFKLSPRARCERWDELLSQCRGSAPLTARLEALAAGLEVEPPSLPTEQRCRDELIGHLLQTFPLSTLPQATARQAFLRQVEGASFEAQVAWEHAARHLLAEWPLLAELDRQLVEDTAGLRNLLKRRLKQQQRHRQPAATSAGSSSGGSWWWVGAVVLVMSGLFRGVNDSSKRSPAPPSYNFHVPQHPESQESIHELLRRVSQPKPFPRSEMPPLRELLDPAKYRVIFLVPSEGLIVQFVPLGTTEEPVRPLIFSEAALRLLGASREQLEELHVRKGGPPNFGDLKLPKGFVGPPAPRSSPNASPRP